MYQSWSMVIPGSLCVVKNKNKKMIKKGVLDRDDGFRHGVCSEVVLTLLGLLCEDFDFGGSPEYEEDTRLVFEELLEWVGSAGRGKWVELFEIVFDSLTGPLADVAVLGLELDEL